MEKNKYKIKILILALIVFLNTILFSINLFAAKKEYGTNGAQNDVSSLVDAEEIRDAFINCIKTDPMGYSISMDASAAQIKDIIESNNIFFGTKSIGVGKRIESQVNPNGDENGRISCNEGDANTNLTALFMKTFGVNDIRNLICSSDGHYTMHTLSWDSNYGKDEQEKNRCVPTNLDRILMLQKGDTKKSIEYVNSIFDDWSKKQPGVLNKNNSTDATVSDSVKLYSAALDAFKGGCLGHKNGEEDYSDKVGENYYDFKIKIIDGASGDSVEKYPHVDEKNYDKQGNNSSKYYIDDEIKKCKTLAEIINKNFDEYKKSINEIRKEKYVKPCATPENIQKANEIISSYVKQEEDKKRKNNPSYFNKAPIGALPAANTNLIVDKEEYDKVLAAVKSGDFTVDDGNGGRKCLETKNLKSCNSAEMRTKAQRIIDEYDRRIVNGETLTDAENKEHKILSAALPKNDFTVDDGNGGKKCLETENFNSTLPSDEDERTAEGENDSSTEEQKQSYCQENGGFLSWMLCPAIADGASTTSGLLGYITGLTTVHDSIIKQFDDQGSSIYKAWSTFRNIANIGFVIMLLVVVFSQVTNIGISNYNIKKILPKLIVTAILVNFSYLILGVLIDLSHIIGNGVGSLIRSVAVDSMDADASARAADLITKIAGMVTGVTGAAGIGAVLLSGPALILPVVMFIVTALISVFFGFITLTIRQAAIIMVIVLAPLMMVLYALPNTSAITKKYLSIVKSLLMLYPMFIFATSAGALASSIIVGTSDDPLMMIVGGLLNVLPYFAIPSMTSKSLAGLGAITGAFDKIRGGALKGAGMAGGAIGASEFYKNMKSDFNSDKNLNRSLSRLRKYKAIEDAGGTLSTSQRRRQTEAAGAVLKDAKMRAGGSAAAGIALSNYEGSGFAGLQAAAQNELMDSEDKNNMMLFANEGYTPDQMVAMLQDASKADYGLMNDDQKRANDSRIRALTKSLMSTKAGQKAFEKQIASNKDMEISNRAFGQMAHAALQTPGLADKYQVMNNQFGNYINKGGDMKGEEVKSGLMGGTYERGMVSTLGDLNAEKLQKISKFEVQKLEESGLDTTNLQAAFNQLGAASLKDPSLIADFDGIKQERVLEAQKSYLEESQKTTINVRGGGTADVYSAPADFGEIASQKVVNGDVVYTNKNGDTFNASKNQTTKNL